MGRHSAPDEGDESPDTGDATGPVAVRTGADRPRPGRHASADATEGPEPALPAPDEDGDDTERETETGPIGFIVAALGRSRPRPGTEAAEAADAAPPDAESEVERTDRIAPIVDPVLDARVPDAATVQIPSVVDAAGPAAGAPDATDTPADETPPGDDGPSDLALLKAQPALRARVAAAIVVPFVLYVLVLVAVDALDVRTTLIWIWIPLVSAGVFAGLLLDLAHRRSRADRALSPADPPATEDSLPPAST